MTIENGKIYKGMSTNYSDIIATIEGGCVYEGTSRNYSDKKFTMNGFLTIEEFVAVWYTVNYVY